MLSSWTRRSSSSRWSCGPAWCPSAYRGLDGHTRLSRGRRRGGRSSEVSSRRGCARSQDTVVVFGDVIHAGDPTETPAICGYGGSGRAWSTHGTLVSDEDRAARRHERRFVGAAPPGAARALLGWRCPRVPESVGEARHALRHLGPEPRPTARSATGSCSRSPRPPPTRCGTPTRAGAERRRVPDRRRDRRGRLLVPWRMTASGCGAHSRSRPRHGPPAARHADRRADASSARRSGTRGLEVRMWFALASA